jgi:two-component system chemotaxis response regulator CheB
MFSAEAAPSSAKSSLGDPSTAGNPTRSRAAFPMCPTCDSALAENQDEAAIRVTNHSGRAPSLNTLLLDVDDAIDKGLSDTLRAVEERVLLLRQMASTAKDAGSGGLADDYSTQANDMLAKTEPLRQMAGGASLFGPVR